MRRWTACGPRHSISSTVRCRRPFAPPADLEEVQRFDLGQLPLPSDYGALLLRLLDSPNIGSKRWAFRQYDWMVGGNTVIGPGSDAAVLRVKGTNKALALSVDCNSRYCLLDPYVGATIPYTPGPGGYGGSLLAWDGAQGKKVWDIKEKFPLWSGTLATAGGVVFYGTLDGWFKAADAKTGKPLWKFKVGSGVVGAPITYRGPDGKQYVAIYAGIGGDWFLLSGDVRSDDPADVRPRADFAPDLAKYTSRGGILWIFGL